MFCSINFNKNGPAIGKVAINAVEMDY